MTVIATPRFRSLLPAGVGGRRGTVGLHRAWPDVKLILVDNAGHLGTADTAGHVVRALDRFVYDE